MANKVKFKINGNTFDSFVSKLSDLSSIDDSVRLKIDKDHILMYSILGERILLAFKNFLIPSSDLINIKDDMDYKLDLVIPNIKKFVKNLSLIKDKDKITIEFTYKESSDDDTIYLVRYFQIVCGKFKINWVGGEHNNETREINKDMLSKNLNLKNSKWSFSLSNEDFIDIKKLSNINSERIINISIDKGIVNFSEKSAWDLEVDNLEDDRSTNLIFNKRFFNCINGNRDKITFSIFETFMLVKDEDDNSNLMLSFEQDFDDDDI